MAALELVEILGVGDVAGRVIRQVGDIAAQILDQIEVKDVDHDGIAPGAGMRHAALRRTDAQIVQQRDMARARDVGVVVQIEAAVEQRRRIAPDRATDMKEMLGRVDARQRYVGISVAVPVGIEQSAGVQKLPVPGNGIHL